jgi:hypothetical protein
VLRRAAGVERVGAFGGLVVVPMAVAVIVRVDIV